MTASASPDLLATIVAATRQRVAVQRPEVPRAALLARAEARPHRDGRFRQALTRPGRTNVIAECKRRSPSRGVIRVDYDPVAMADAYERGGAAAVSVLTEPTFFDGALAHLEQVRQAIDLPVLRKDFIVDAYQVIEAAAAGADAILLIVAALDDEALAGLSAQARSFGMDALVEVHDERELARAVDQGAEIVGVNNRNLRTLEVDVAVSQRLLPRIPKGVTAVAESGFRTPDELRALRQGGYQAFLVGEGLMTSADPEAAVRRLVAA